VSNHTTKDASQTTSKIQPCNEPTCLFTLVFGSISTNIHLTDHFNHYNQQPVTLTRTSRGSTDVAVVRLRNLWKKQTFHDAERVCRSQCTHSPVQTTSTTVFEQVRMQKCRPTTKKMALFRWKDLKMALSLTERRQILWRFFHSTTMMLQSVTICNGALPQLTWKRPSTTSTFHPLPSSITLLLPFHVFFRC